MANTSGDSTDEKNRSFKEELERKDKLLQKEAEKNKKLAHELEHVKTLLEREKRQNQQYSQDMEAEMEKRDQELEKKETEIFEMMEKHQRQLSQIENLKSDLTESNQQNQTLAQQLTRCQVQLQEERNRTIPTPITNETALFDAESKVEELRATMETMKVDMNRLLDANCAQEERILQLQLDLTTSKQEHDSCLSLIQCQQKEMERAQTAYQELQIQMHQLQSDGANKEIAPRGNSLFAEVIDGKEKLENQLLLLHQRNRKLEAELRRVTKLAYENAMSRVQVLDGQMLNGPTLGVFKVVKAESEMLMNERQELLEKLHALEDAERREVIKLARENPAEFNIFQENIHSMTLYAKQRLENRVKKLEIREQELLAAVCYEKERASSVPQLELQLEQHKRLLAQYEKQQLALDEEDKENGSGQGSIIWPMYTPARG